MECRLLRVRQLVRDHVVDDVQARAWMRRQLSRTSRCASTARCAGEIRGADRSRAARCSARAAQKWLWAWRRYPDQGGAHGPGMQLPKASCRTPSSWAAQARSAGPEFRRNCRRGSRPLAVLPQPEFGLRAPLRFAQGQSESCKNARCSGPKCAETLTMRPRSSPQTARRRLALR
jgi:hypothetical protein